jgi:hypothetical protein
MLFIDYVKGFDLIAQKLWEIMAERDFLYI